MNRSRETFATIDAAAIAALLGVAIDDRPARPLEVLAEREAIAQAQHARPGDAPQRVAQRRQVRLVQPEAVDPAGAARDDPVRRAAMRSTRG